MPWYCIALIALYVGWVSWREYRKWKNKEAEFNALIAILQEQVERDEKKGCSDEVD